MRYRGYWLAAAWLQVGAVIVLGLLPSMPSLGFSFGDKIAHFIEFFVVMAWFGGLYEARGQRIAFAGLALLGAGIELLQGLQLFRTLDLGDLVANLAGLLAGWLAARTWLHNWCARVEAAIAA